MTEEEFMERKESTVRSLLLQLAGKGFTVDQVNEVLYTRASIERAEGLEGDENPMSPFERRRLEKRIRELEKKVSSYEDQFYFLSDAMERVKKMMNQGEKSG